MSDYQQRASQWAIECFGQEKTIEPAERAHRFIEESLELVQSLSITKEEVLQLVDYVYGRPKGEPTQEVGGTYLTLALLCSAHDISMEQSAETELKRVWDKISTIRNKQANKPKNSPLPQ